MDRVHGETKWDALRLTSGRRDMGVTIVADVSGSAEVTDPPAAAAADVPSCS